MVVGNSFKKSAFLPPFQNQGKWDTLQLAKIRPAYQAQMEALDGALRAGGLGDLGWIWKRPEGGLYLWLEAPNALDTGLESEFCQACVEAGVLYVPGALCFGDSPTNYCIRLSFGVLDLSGLKEAARRFVGITRRFTKQPDVKSDGKTDLD
ncbi:MAG: hypothetical protein J6386_19695 [Candidatus Synoicihabitans palmerolidicus]|nr:hypothetical protein [Candidatus Synoicihabitans palmerolidicus]